MVARKDLTVWALIAFTIVYMSFGDQYSKIWTGIYFMSNYTLMLSLFLKDPRKKIRIAGVSVCISILVFLPLRFFAELPFELRKPYNLITFTVCFLALTYLENKK